MRGPAAHPVADGSRPGAVQATHRLLELDGIEKRWPRRNEPVLDGAGIALGRGHQALVTGRNGAGKTTLLRIAAGLIFPDRGTVALAGLDPVRDRRAYQRRLGFLAAGNSGLYARLSVRRHLDYWARLAFIPRSERTAAVGRALTRFQLHELADRRVDRMSMGQRQRVRIAGAFLHDPDLVLLDEPHTSLDDDGLAILAAAVHGLTSRGGAVLWCAPGEVADCLKPGRRYVMEAGKVLEK